MNILITGDSHLASLDRALTSNHNIAQGHNVSICPLGNSEDSHKPYFEDAQDHIDITLERFQSHTDRLPPNGETPDVIAVSMLFHTLRILRVKKLWANFAPASLGKTDCHSITKTTFKRMVLNQQQHNLAMIQALQKYVPKVVAIEGPRLFTHHTCFENSDEKIVTEVDRLYRDIMRAELDRLKIPIVDCPIEAYTTQTGLMKMQYRTEREGDYHHASTEFGELVLKDLVASVEGSATSRLH